MMQVMPGMLSTMGTPFLTLRGNRKNAPEHVFPPHSGVAQNYGARSAAGGAGTLSAFGKGRGLVCRPGFK